MKDKETASSTTRVLPSTKKVLKHMRARINLKRLKIGLPELSGPEVLDLAARNLTVEAGIKE